MRVKGVICAWYVDVTFSEYTREFIETLCVCKLY